ncbi:MAG TPA: 30S ribosomal protein S20 [Firmicutes bacterium]|mgnify:CR=1 FL=1|nr:30S ribosomal protein S20 [Bacillota bacterium]
MANSRSAEKRVKVNRQKRARNISGKSALKTIVKKYEAALANDPTSAPAHLRQAFKALDQAAAKGIIHKNTASRKKSRLSKRLAKNA